jgi:asparagine synthase (glutamine-hydrolysing)
MCGIAGIAALNGHDPIAENMLARMVDYLRNRGPDGVGFFQAPGIGLGHSRLSIIDLVSGDQPIHNMDRTAWLVFNGEIFNHVEIRQSLIQKGYVFYTQSDTEVIVHLYDEYGLNFVDHLNGQFAIALWDGRQQRLILARDRTGILPLYYTQCHRQLRFASEIKALLAVSSQAPALDTQALDQIMTYWAPVSPRTIFKDIFEVSPGELLILVDGKICKQRYWDWQFPKYNEYPHVNEKDLCKKLYELLADATRIRLRADVPVGAYLSGGLDSSTIATLIAQQNSSSLRTFSLNFSDEHLDEYDYQRLIIDKLNTQHSQVHCNHTDIAEQFVQTIWRTESPILRTAPTPMGFLSALVRQKGYKVVLTGEGADEVLGGYDIFKENKIRQFWARQPQSKWRPLLLKRLYPYLNLKEESGQYYLEQFFGMALDKPDLLYFSHLPRWTTTARCKLFFSQSLKDQLLPDFEHQSLQQILPKDINAWHPFARAQYIEAKTLLSGYLLCMQGDRMLMSNSVEGRFPFLDHRLIEFANGLHPKWKMRALKEKYLLKKVMAPHLPAEIVQRHKQPYQAPDAPPFFTAGINEVVQTLTSSEMVSEFGYFDPAKVDKLITKIRQGRPIGYRDNMAFIGILSTQIWHYHFVKNYHINFG